MVEYFCTCGRGTEVFLVDEIRQHFMIEKICQIDGKVYFTLSNSPDEVDNTSDTSHTTTQSSEESEISVLTVSHVSGKPLCADVGPSCADVGPSCADVGPSCADVGSSCADVGPSCADVGPSCGDVGPSCADVGPSCADIGPSDEQNCSDLSKLKFNKLNSMQMKIDHRKLLSLKCCERLFVCVLRDAKITKTNYHRTVSQLKAVLYRIEASDWLKCLETWQGLQPDFTPQETADSSKYKQSAATTVTGKHTSHILEKTSTCSDEPVSKRLKLTDTVSDGATSFRVSAKCSGSFSRILTSEELSRVAGPVVSRQTGWKVNLKKPDLEVYMQLNDDGLVVGIPVTKVPLSKRSYLRHCGLRTTVAASMASLASLKPGMCVLDPMCGQGTILIEASKQYPNCQYWGVDMDIEQCTKSRENTIYSVETHRINIIRASVAGLPFKEESFDTAICDIPFGVQYGSLEENQKLYPQIISNLDRVLKRGAKTVLLVGASMKDALLSIVDQVTRQSDSLMESDFRRPEESLPERNQDTENICTSQINTQGPTSGQLLNPSKHGFHMKETGQSSKANNGESLSVYDNHALTVTDTNISTSDRSLAEFDNSSLQPSINVALNSTCNEQLDSSNTQKHSHSLEVMNSGVKKTISDTKHKVNSALDTSNYLLSVSEDNVTDIRHTDAIPRDCNSVVVKREEEEPVERASEVITEENGSKTKEKVNKNVTLNVTSECNVGDSNCNSGWTRELVHYVKLGETHAYICVFTKRAYM